MKLEKIINKNNIEIKKINNSYWIVQHSGKYFRITNHSKNLLSILLNNKFNVKKSYEDYIKKYDHIDEITFKDIVNKIIVSLELLDTNKNDSSFIYFENKIISANKAKIISNFLKPLYNPIFFWISITFLFILSIYINFKSRLQYMEPKYIVIIIFFYILSSFLHELGHIACCNKFSGKNGEIGIGMYFVFPVFYSNISDIWTVNKTKRIITNLAGIYIQLYINLILILLNVYFKNPIVNNLIILTNFLILYQLFPFIRSDGYWTLSDITNIPNLQTKGSIMLSTIYKNPKYIINLNIKNIFILIYGILNYLLMFYILYNIIIVCKYSIIKMPIEIIKIIFNIEKNNTLLNYINNNLIIMINCFIFYVFIFNILKNINNKKP